MGNITFVLNDGIKKIFGMLLSICILATAAPCVVFGAVGSPVTVSFPKDTNIFVGKGENSTKKNGLYILKEGETSASGNNDFLVYFRGNVKGDLPYNLSEDEDNHTVKSVKFNPNPGTDLSTLDFFVSLNEGCAFKWNDEKYLYNGAGGIQRIEYPKMLNQETVSAKAGYGTKVKLSKEVAENLQNDGVTEIKVKFGADKNTPEDTVKFDTKTAKSGDVEEIAITSKKDVKKFISTTGGRYYKIEVESKEDDEKGFSICELNASISKKTVNLISESEKGKVYLRTYEGGESIDRELKANNTLNVNEGEKADIVLKPNPGYAVKEEKINDPEHGLKYVEEDLGEGNEAWKIFGIWDDVKLNANDLFDEAESEVKGVNKLEALGIESLEVDSSDLPGNVVVEVDLMNDSDKNEMTKELKSNGCITAENDVYSFFNMNVKVDGKKVSELKEPIKITIKLSDDSLNEFSEKIAAENTIGNPMLVVLHETKGNGKILCRVYAEDESMNLGADKSVTFSVKEFSPYAIIFTNKAANSYLKTGENIEVIAIMMSLLVMAGGWLFIDNKRKLKY